MAEPLPFMSPTGTPLLDRVMRLMARQRRVSIELSHAEAQEPGGSQRIRQLRADRERIRSLLHRMLDNS